MLKAIFFCPIFQVSQGFIQALNCLHLPEVKLNLKLSFETRSFKPKNKKVIKTVWTPYLFFFLPLGVIKGVKRKIAVQGAKPVSTADVFLCHICFE